MELPLFEDFTEEHYKRYGSKSKKCEVLETERHVYETPFMYPNLDVGGFHEINSDKGIEFKANDGYITIKEEMPIMGVTVVGSGCTAGGYNICEWWDEGETMDNIKTQLVKRLRVDNLNGMHPSIWSLLMMGLSRGQTFDLVSEGDITGVVDALKKLSNGYYGGMEMGFYENSVDFRVGRVGSYPNKVTIRSGCKGTEDPGTNIERYPADYAIRLVETTVIKSV